MQYLEKDVYPELINLLDKYEELVWYARKPRIDRVDQDYSNLPEEMRDLVKQCIRSTEEKYPEEINSLKTDSSNWEHGFNSGCLASLRLIIYAISHGIDDAMEDFPNLDT